MRYLFIGERRSERAKQMGVTWGDGKLSAKTLFLALREVPISLDDCQFVNLFEHGGPTIVQRAVRDGRILVAMGRKVQKALDAYSLPYVALIHPAARGAIRKQARYIAHVQAAFAAPLTYTHSEEDL